MAENARGSLSSYGEKLCLINFDQGTKVIHPKYSHLSNIYGGLEKKRRVSRVFLQRTSNMDHQLLRQIFHQKFSVMKTKKLVLPEKNILFEFEFPRTAIMQ